MSVGSALQGTVHRGRILRANPLMLLATCVNSFIYCSVFHNLRAHVARCSPSCVNGAQNSVPFKAFSHQGFLRCACVGQRALCLFRRDRTMPENEWWPFPMLVGIYQRWPWCEKAFSEWCKVHDFDKSWGQDPLGSDAE